MTDLFCFSVANSAPTFNESLANQAVITLNKLNYLLGKENLKDEFKKLYSSNPDIVKALPVLLAVRENKLEVFDKVTKNSEFFDFSGTEKDSEKYYFNS